MKINVILLIFQNSVLHIKTPLVYTVSQEDRSVLWEIIVSIILSKNVYMNMCPIPKDFRDRAI